MPTTTYGIVYPSSTDAPRIWEDMQALAESVDTAAFDGVGDDNFATAAAGFTISLMELETFGRYCALRMNVTSTNALTVTAGNITDVTMATLDNTYWPAIQTSFSTYGGIHAGGYLVADGRLRLANADTTIPAAANLEFGFTYMLSLDAWNALRA